MGSAASLAGEDIVTDSHIASTSFLHSWPTREGWLCTLNLGGVFFIIPERNFHDNCKAQLSAHEGREKDQSSYGKWMVNTADNH